MNYIRNKLKKIEKIYQFSKLNNMCSCLFKVLTSLSIYILEF